MELLKKYLTNKVLKKHPEAKQNIIEKAVSRYLTEIFDYLHTYNNFNVFCNQEIQFTFPATKLYNDAGQITINKKRYRASVIIQEATGFLEVIDKGTNLTHKLSIVRIHKHYSKKFKMEIQAQMDLNKVTKEYMEMADNDNLTGTLIDVDLEHIERMIYYPKTDPNIISHLHAIHKLASKLGGKLPQYFDTSTTGRIYGKGALSLQTCKKELRYVCLPRCHSYDLKASAVGVISQMAKDVCEREGIDYATPYCDEYVKNRKDIREEVAKHVFQTNDIYSVGTRNYISYIKEAFTCLGFGAKAQVGSPQHTALPNVIYGRENLKRFLEHPFVKGFTKELKEIQKIIVHQYGATRDGMEVVAGFPYSHLDEDGKAKSDSQFVAHVYQGIERTILDTALEYVHKQSAKHGTDLLLLPIHDGFLTRHSLDIADLNYYVQTKTGLKVVFEHDAIDTSNNGKTKEEREQALLNELNQHKAALYEEEMESRAYANNYALEITPKSNDVDNVMRGITARAKAMEALRESNNAKREDWEGTYDNSATRESYNSGRREDW